MATNPRAVVLLLLLFLLLFSSDPQTQQLPQRFRFDDILDREFAALNVLNHSSYGAFDAREDKWLNITGFRKSDEFAWEALNAVKERVKEKVEWILDGDAARRFLDGEDGDAESGKAKLPLYRNISGFARGTWVRSKTVTNITAPTLNRTTLGISTVYGNLPFNRNITGDSGTVRFHFDERGLEFLQEKDGVKEAKAQLTIHDKSSSGEGWEMKLHGVHFLDGGLMIMSTTSEKFAGMFGLPHFMPSNATFNSSLNLLNGTIREVIEEQKADARIVTNPWTSASDGTTEGLFSPPHCEYIVWLQQHPLNMPEGSDGASGTQYPLESVEKELRYPTGYIYSPPPNMKMEMVIFSPDCGFVLESKGPPDYAPAEAQHLLGPKVEIITNIGRHLSMVFGAVLCGQIYLALVQMKEASTPSVRSRISFYTVAILSMGDGFTAMAFLPLGMFVESMFLNFLAVSFFAFFSVTFLDLRFLMDIWMVQDEERRRQQRQQASRSSGESTPLPTTPAPPTPSRDPPVPPAPAPTPAITNTPAGTGTLPLPVSARRNLMAGAMPISVPPDQDEPGTPTIAAANDSPTRRFGALYTRFYALLLIIIFLSLHATSWPLGLRSAYMNLLAFVYLSAWIPQIYRNTMRNCRKALLWKYVVGQSVFRLVPFAYFYGVYDNVLFVENDRRTLLVLAGWVWIQVWILIIQNLLGPRIFVKKSWVPPAYDYHPILREDEEGATMPIGFTQATEAAPTAPSSPTPLSRQASVVEMHKGKRVYDCAICMQDIEVPVVPIGGAETSSAASLPANILARRAYMVTPYWLARYVERHCRRFEDVLRIVFTSWSMKDKDEPQNAIQCTETLSNTCLNLDNESCETATQHFTTEDMEQYGIVMLLAYWNSLLGVAIVGLFGVIYKQGPPGNRLAAPEPTLALEGGDNTKNFYNLPVSKMPLRLWDVTSRVLHPLHLDQQHLETTPTNYTVPVPAPPEPAESVKYYVKGKVTMAEWRNVHARGLTLLWAGMALVYGFVGYVNRAASKRKHP